MSAKSRCLFVPSPRPFLNIKQVFLGGLNNNTVKVTVNIAKRREGKKVALWAFVVPTYLLIHSIAFKGSGGKSKGHIYKYFSLSGDYKSHSFTSYLFGGRSSFSKKNFFLFSRPLQC